MEWLTALTEATREGRPVVLLTVVEGPGLGGHLVADTTGILASEVFEPGLRELAGRFLGTEGARTVRAPGGQRVYVESFLPAPELVVVGAGHVAQPVAHLGKLLGFRVTVLDDRTEYANASRFPTADEVICGEFLGELQRIDPGPRHHLVLVTRGHRQDMACLRAVIERPVAYIGMIGSRIRVETVFRLLAEECGVDPVHFGKVYAPIGLDVGARSPAEIAVAVAAELLKGRSGGTGESLSRLTQGMIHRRQQPWTS